MDDSNATITINSSQYFKLRRIYRDTRTKGQGFYNWLFTNFDIKVHSVDTVKPYQGTPEFFDENSDMRIFVFPTVEQALLFKLTHL